MFDIVAPSNSERFNIIGLILAFTNSFAATSFLALTNFLPVKTVLILLARGSLTILLSALLFSMIWSPFVRVGIRKNMKLIFFRASINGITITAKATCVRYMSVADVAVLNQTIPVFVCVFAALFLNEKTTFVDSLIISSCFLGVFFILQPHFFFHSINSSLGVNGQVLVNNRNYFLASGFLLVSAMINAATTVMLKKLATEVHFAAIMFTSGISTIVYGLLGLVIAAHLGHLSVSSDLCFPNFVVRWLVLCAGLLGYAAQFTNIMTLRKIKASVKSVLCSTLNVLLGSLFTILLTPEQENFNLWKVMGGVLVIISGFLLYAKKEGKFSCGRKVDVKKLISIVEKPLLLEVDNEEDDEED